MSNNLEVETLSTYWQKKVKSWQSSGKTQRDYCKANDLSYHRFGYWRRKFILHEKSNHSSGFVAVTQIEASPPCGLSLSLPNGLELRGIAEDNLLIVYQILARLS